MSGSTFFRSNTGATWSATGVGKKFSAHADTFLWAVLRRSFVTVGVTHCEELEEYTFRNAISASLPHWVA